MDFFLKDKVAIVTGAASGMGCAVAIMLAAEGVRVAAADIFPACDRGETGKVVFTWGAGENVA